MAFGNLLLVHVYRGFAINAHYKNSHKYYKMKTAAYYINKLLIVGACVVLLSCEKVLLVSDPENSPETNFTHMWTEINNRYSYFELKQIDWNEIHAKYQSEIYEDMNDKVLFKVLANMLYELHDGHVNLSSEFDRSRNWEWFLDYNIDINIHNIEKNYLGKNYYSTGPFRNTIIDSVLYIYYESFSNNFSDKNLNELMDRAKNLDGVIIDIRKNGGGRLSNAIRIASCFTDKTTLYARERTKTGPGKNDFSSWTDMKITPRNGEQYLGNVVVLCNRSCYSASSFFSQMMRSLPNATLLGQQTGGGGGVPAYCELPNGWIYRFSVTQTVTPQGEHIEPGVPVDIEVSLDFEDEVNGIDTLIESAIKYLKDKK